MYIHAYKYVYTCTCIYIQTSISVHNSRVQKAIRRRSAEEEVRKHQDRVTRAWKQISKQRRRVDVSCDPSMVTALRHGTWMDEESFKKTCVKEKEKKEGPIRLCMAHVNTAETKCGKIYAGQVFE